MNAQHVLINQVDPNQVRSRSKTSDTKELVNSIKDVGKIQSLLNNTEEDRTYWLRDTEIRSFKVSRIKRNAMCGSKLI